MGAFDTVSRATTNHGLHRGSYQCTSEITKKDGTKLKVAYYTGAATGVLTNGETFSYDKNEIESYVVTGLKYVPVKVKTEDYEAFKAAYTVVENGSTLSGGFSEGNLKNYTDLVAEVTENTNGLKTVTQNEDGSFSFAARVNNGTDSGIKDAALKTAENITTTVKEANGSYGEFLRVDLTGDGYGALGADMQAAEWTYYGSDSTYTDPLQSYGTKFASDNWMHKAQGIQLGLTDSLRCKLPAGTDGTGYWTITVYALGYNDYTVKFKVTDANIVKDEEETVDTTALEAAIKSAENLTESDYTAASWSDLCVELKEAKDELAAPHTQSTVDEATEHLNAAIKALVKAETKEETKTDDTEENTEYDVSMFTSIDVDGVVDAFKSSEMKVIYMGRSTCGYCVQFLPNLQKAQEEYGYETLYLDISTVDSDGQSKIVDLDKDFFEENYGATPTVLLVKDNKIVDSHVGYSEYDDYAKFLEKNGFSKK